MIIMEVLSLIQQQCICKCCLHSFYYILSIYFHCNAIPWSESELTVESSRGTFVHGSEGSQWELSLRGAKIPGTVFLPDI